jgi:cytochrome P450
LRRTAETARRSIPSVVRLARHIPFFANDPAHARQRRGLGASLGFAKARFGPSADAAVQRLLAPLRAAGGGDFATDFAARLHVEVTADLLGAPEADRAELSRLAALGRTLDDAVPLREYLEAETSIVRLSEYMLDLLRDQRRAPKGTLLEDMARRLEPDPGDDPDLSIATSAAALLALGRDTVSGAITLGLAALLDDNGGRIGPSLLAPADGVSEEFIRYSSSAQYVKRQILSDIEIDGTAIKAGDHVVILVAGGNRDPGRFSEPASIRPDRPRFSLAFGYGAHSCLGAPLARQEITSAVGALAALPGLESREGRRFGRSRATRGYVNFPVSIPSV